MPLRKDDTQIREAFLIFECLRTIRSPGPGTRAATRAAEASAQAQGLLQDSWERARLNCERPGACLDQGASIGRISQKEKENRGTQGLVRELSAAAAAPGAPPRSAAGL